MGRQIEKQEKWEIRKRIRDRDERETYSKDRQIYKRIQRKKNKHR